MEGNYAQYIKNIGNNEIHKNNVNNNANKKTFKNNNWNNKKKGGNFNKPKIINIKPKLFNYKIDNKKSNEINQNKNNNNIKRSKSEFNKSFNKNINIKFEKDNLNNLDIYDLIKFDEKLINKGYFYEKNKK